MEDRNFPWRLLVLLGMVTVVFMPVLLGQPPNERELVSAKSLVEGLDRDQKTMWVAVDSFNAEGIFQGQNFEIVVVRKKITKDARTTNDIMVAEICYLSFAYIGRKPRPIGCQAILVEELASNRRQRG